MAPARREASGAVRARKLMNNARGTKGGGQGPPISGRSVGVTGPGRVSGGRRKWAVGWDYVGRDKEKVKMLC